MSVPSSQFGGFTTPAAGQTQPQPSASPMPTENASSPSTISSLWGVPASGASSSSHSASQQTPHSQTHAQHPTGGGGAAGLFALFSAQTRYGSAFAAPPLPRAYLSSHLHHHSTAENSSAPAPFPSSSAPASSSASSGLAPASDPLTAAHMAFLHQQQQRQHHQQHHQQHQHQHQQQQHPDHLHYSPHFGLLPPAASHASYSASASSSAACSDTVRPFPAAVSTAANHSSSASSPSLPGAHPFGGQRFVALPSGSVFGSGPFSLPGASASASSDAQLAPSVRALFEAHHLDTTGASRSAASSTKATVQSTSSGGASSLSPALQQLFAAAPMTSQSAAHTSSSSSSSSSASLHDQAHRSHAYSQQQQQQQQATLSRRSFAEAQTLHSGVAAATGGNTTASNTASLQGVQQHLGALEIHSTQKGFQSAQQSFQRAQQDFHSAQQTTAAVYQTTTSDAPAPLRYYIDDRVRNLRDPQGRRKPRRSRRQRRDSMQKRHDSEDRSLTDAEEAAEEAAALEAEAADAEATRLALREQVTAPSSLLPLAYPGKERVASLQEDLLAVYDTLVPPPRDIENRLNLLTRLRTLVGRCFRNNNPKLMLFGSTASDLCCRGGDVDLCLLIDKSAGTSKRVISRLVGLLRKNGMENVVDLSRARVPIVKFSDRRTKMNCDICLNNHLALRNTSLIAAYVGLDPRVRPLLFLIKHWAKCRNINETYTGTLSSYAYVLLAVNFLQRIRPPVVPCLQDKAACAARVEPVYLNGFDCTFYTPASHTAPNTDSLARLALLFFRYYAHEFCWEDHVVTVRTGGVQRKKDKQWLEPEEDETAEGEHHFGKATESDERAEEEVESAERKSKKRDYFLVAIEDPFEVSHNLGRVVDRAGFETLRYEFARCYHLLASNAPLELVFQSYKDPVASFAEAGLAAVRLQYQRQRHNDSLLAPTPAEAANSPPVPRTSGRSHPPRARSTSMNNKVVTSTPSSLSSSPTPTAVVEASHTSDGGSRQSITSNNNSGVNGHRSRSRSSGGRRRGGGHRNTNGGRGGGGGNVQGNNRA